MSSSAIGGHANMSAKIIQKNDIQGMILYDDWGRTQKVGGQTPVAAYIGCAEKCRGSPAEVNVLR